VWERAGGGARVACVSFLCPPPRAGRGEAREASLTVTLNSRLSSPARVARDRVPRAAAARGAGRGAARAIARVSWSDSRV
jgi:hypothetical protein